MKKIIILLCAFLGTLHVNAENDVPAILFFHNDSIIQSFLRSDVDSMRYSYIDINGEKQNEVVTQLVYLKDTIIQIPLAEIDSVVHTPPSYNPQYSEEPNPAEVLPRGEELYTQVTDGLYDYLKSHDGATIEDIQKQLKKYSSLVASEVKDGVLYLSIDSIYEYICDPYRKTCPIGGEDFTEEIEEFENLMAEIHDALYPDEQDSQTRSSNLWEYPTGKSSSRADGAYITLTKHELHIWDPWKQIRADFYSDAHKTNGESLADMSEFGKYDIVLLICHGTPDGCVCVPKNSAYLSELGNKKHKLRLGIDYILGSTGVGLGAKEAYILKENALKKFLKGNLSETILWTSMCYANVSGSVLKSVAQKLDIAAFAGADKMVYMDGDPQYWLSKFSNILYVYREYAGTCAQRAFKASSNDAPVTVSYNEPENGVYSFEYYKHIHYKPFVEVKKEVNNQPRASITMPYELFSKYHSAIATRGFDFTRASSDGGISAGFWIRNKETREIMEIAFNNSTVKKYENEHNPCFYPKSETEPKEIARIELLGITDDLREGTYEYRTYLEIDGEKEYSEEMYEFTISDELNVYTDPNFGFPCIDGFADCSSLIGKNYSEMVEILKGYVKLKGKGSRKSNYISKFFSAPYGELTISISNATQKVGHVEQHFSYSSDFREPDKILRYLKSRYYLYDYDGGGNYWFCDNKDPEKVTKIIFLTKGGRSILYDSVEWLKEEAEWINEHW